MPAPRPGPSERVSCTKFAPTAALDAEIAGCPPEIGGGAERLGGAHGVHSPSLGQMNLPAYAIISHSGHTRARAAMVHFQLEVRGVRDERVLAAMAEIPRHLFVPDALRDLAYAERPLPIGYGQTISQPLMVATLLQALELDGSERVLDVGTGCGYQAALLARLAKEVYSIEIVEALADGARLTLDGLDIQNATVIVGDGGHGFAEAAPYDAIVVAAGCHTVPKALLEQLAVGGRLVIPVGRSGAQKLLQIEKTASGECVHRVIGDCAFVPLLGAHVSR
jgi:protein-L-isoaspartate(D-aspartate) O-methyltransferase